MKCKCISYSVDPIALRNGVPVDKLERKNVQEIDPPPPNMSPFQKNTCHLYKAPEEVATIPRPQSDRRRYKELRVSPKQFTRLMAGEIIRTGGGVVGRVYKVVNQETESFVLCQLYTVSQCKYLTKIR